MQFLPTNNQWKAMLLYYRVNKLQKILVTAWRRRKRLTVAGFFFWIWKQTRKHCSCTTFSSIFYFGQITDLFDILSSALHLQGLKKTSLKHQYPSTEHKPRFARSICFLKTFWSLENLLTFWSRWRWDNCPWKFDMYNRKLIWHVIRSNSKSILLLGPFLVVDI